MSGENWRTSLVRNGYVRLPNLCQEPLVSTARAAIDADLAANYDPSRPAALHDGMRQIPPGDPVQLMPEPGDVVLCHYGLAHTAAVNLSDADRYAVYFRLWLNDIDDQRWHLMTHVWDGWRLA